MKLRIITEDPLKILHSTKRVIEKAKFVILHRSNISKISRLISGRLAKGLEIEYYESLGSTGDFEDDVQLIFVQDAVNFCFWSEKDKPKWAVEWPRGNVISGGWYGLKASFERALVEKVLILDAEYLSSITPHDVKNLFRSSNGTEIPLLEERRANLREAGKILLKKFDGHFINVLQQANNDAVKLIKLIYQNFPSFRDIQFLEGKEVIFLKRAQICANDISYLLKKKGKSPLKNVDQLTVFADYKLPQILRMFDVLEYSKDLAERIDNYVLIPQGSREEIEIRAATIWGIELIRQELNKYTAAQIDNVLWLISQNLSKESKPYHRTRTIYY